MSDYKLVPVEPTAEMEQAAESYWNKRRFKGLSNDPRTWAGVYQAMLAAAPDVQGPPEGFDIGQQAPDGRGGIVIGYIGGDAVVMGRRESEPMTWGRGVDWCEKFNDSSGEPGWRMPSEEELSLAWDNRDQLTGLSMGSVWYWTSTQYSADYAMIRDFSKGYKSKGYKFINHKDYDHRVRPVRRLKI